MKNQIGVILGFVILTAVLAAVSFYGIATLTNAIDEFTALKQKEIENEARFQCAQSSRYQIQQSKDVTVWYPVSDLYSKCLIEKGIE